MAEARTLVKSREAELASVRAQLDAAQKRELAAEAASAARDELPASAMPRKKKSPH